MIDLPPWYVVVATFAAVIAIATMIGNRYGGERGVWAYVVGGLVLTILYGGFRQFIG